MLTVLWLYSNSCADRDEFRQRKNLDNFRNWNGRMAVYDKIRYDTIVCI